MYFCEMSVRVQGNSCRAYGILYQRTIKGGLPGGGAIWWPYVSSVAWIWCGMVMARVAMGGSPGFHGLVDSIQRCGVDRCFGRAV